MKKNRRAAASLTCQPAMSTVSYGSSTHLEALQAAVCFASIVFSPSTESATATRCGVGFVRRSAYSAPRSASTYVVPWCRYSGRAAPPTTTEMSQLPV